MTTRNSPATRIQLTPAAHAIAPVRTEDTSDRTQRMRDLESWARGVERLQLWKRPTRRQTAHNDWQVSEDVAENVQTEPIK